jgi:hypothetical protein
MNLKNLLLLVSCAALVTSCKNGGLFGKKKIFRRNRGINDKNQGFQFARERNKDRSWSRVRSGWYLQMGATEDVMGD